VKPVPLLHVALHAAATSHVPWQLTGHGVLLMQATLRTAPLFASQAVPLFCACTVMLKVSV
jgi:hypothetical protein